MSQEQTKRIIDLVTGIAISVGVVGVVAAAFLSESTTPIAGSFLSALATALTTISISLIGFAIFNLAIETQDWKKYFGERIREVVIENDYLSTLGPDTLKEVQTKLLKAQFKNQAIDKEGSFLHYFHHNLHRFISEPYRENVSTEVHMTRMEGESDRFNVKDKVTYACRTSGGAIQQHIGWKPDDGEFEKVVSLKIRLLFPLGSVNSGKTITIYDKDDDSLQDDLKGGVKIPLDDYKELDNLIVTTEAEYIVKLGKFQYWQMAHPTKDFEITIIYPEDCSIQFKTLVLEDVASQITEHAGYLRFAYASWALPQSGLTWLIRKAD